MPRAISTRRSPAYRDGLAIRERLAAADPTNAEWQRDLSVSYNKIGDVLVAQGNLDEALARYRDGLAIRERLAAADPGNTEWQRDLSVSFNKIGDVLRAQGKLDEALAATATALPSPSALPPPTPPTPSGRLTWPRASADWPFLTPRGRGNDAQRHCQSLKRLSTKGACHPTNALCWRCFAAPIRPPTSLTAIAIRAACR